MKAAQSKCAAKGVLIMMTLFEIASHQSRWLAVRQAVTAENIANASTPGYVAKDVAAFEDHLARLSAPGIANGPQRVDDTSPWQVRPSGNSVSIEEELIRSGGVTRAHALNTGIVSAFHRLHLAAVRG
jgi:flagellar basal-body rod protein FlgB